jgi:hypothetical protein
MRAELRIEIENSGNGRQDGGRIAPDSSITNPLGGRARSLAAAQDDIDFENRRKRRGFEISKERIRTTCHYQPWGMGLMSTNDSAGVEFCGT